MLVHSAVEQYVVSSPARKESGLLYVSDLGAHPYKAMARILNGETAEFDTNTRIKMNHGNAFEAETLRAMQHKYPNVQTQFPLYNRRSSLNTRPPATSGLITNNRYHAPRIYARCGCTGSFTRKPTA